MCAVCFENWCSTFVLSCSVHSSVGSAPRVAVRPSLCSGPALPLFVGLLLVTLFSHQSLLQEKTNFFETVSELFEQRKTDTCLQLCAVSCLNQKRTRTVHSTLSRDVGFFLTNVELSVQSQRVHCCAGSQESESTSPFRARTAPRLASADWKRQVTENLHFNFLF